MGRITIFAVDDCFHCVRVTTSLQEERIPFTVISLSSHPNRRVDMLSLTDRLTVPQVFFNEEHVGGAEDTLVRLEAWKQREEEDGDSEEKQKRGSPLQFYLDEIASKPNPGDPRLQPSTDPPVPVMAPRRRSSSDSITLPDGSSVSVVTMMETLKRILPRGIQKRKTTMFKQAFNGVQALHALAQEFFVLKEKDQMALANQLRDRQIWHPLVEQHDTMEASEKCLFRLQCFHTPDVLNSYRVWTTSVDPDCMALVLRLKQQLDEIERNVTNKDTGGVDYASVQSHPDFSLFEEAVCELQRVNMAKLDRNTLLAFSINCYNLFIKFAFMKLGIGSSSRSRSAFFNGVKFNVGGDIFSFQDWEHGVLRCNRKAPYALRHQFGKKDLRLVLADKIAGDVGVDCRIHFALNCGAKSCPPMRTFTAQGIDEELRIVSQAFCEDDDNCEISVKKRTLSLNKILYWYKSDFASCDMELVNKVVEFLRGDKQKQLQLLIDDGKPIKVTFKSYDWSFPNASDFVPFDSAILRADVQRSFATQLKHTAKKALTKAV